MAGISFLRQSLLNINGNFTQLLSTDITRGWRDPEAQTAGSSERVSAEAPLYALPYKPTSGHCQRQPLA